MNFILFTRQITRTLYYVDEFIPSPKRFKIFTHKSDIKKKKKYTCTNLTEWLLFIHIYKNCIQYYTYTLILKFTIQRNNNKKFNGSENRLKKPSIDPLLVHSAENIAGLSFFLFTFTPKQKTNPGQTIESNCPLARNQTFLASSKKTTDWTSCYFSSATSFSRIWRNNDARGGGGKGYTQTGGTRRRADFRPGEKKRDSI